jgi:hypothetical protein
MTQDSSLPSVGFSDVAHFSWSLSDLHLLRSSRYYFSSLEQSVFTTAGSIALIRFDPRVQFPGELSRESESEIDLPLRGETYTQPYTEG